MQKACSNIISDWEVKHELLLLKNSLNEDFKLLSEHNPMDQHIIKVYKEIQMVLDHILQKQLGEYGIKNAAIFPPTFMGEPGEPEYE
jgi:hypothetical protein